MKPWDFKIILQRQTTSQQAVIRTDLICLAI